VSITKGEDYVDSVATGPEKNGTEIIKVERGEVCWIMEATLSFIRQEC
jgi:hypothetical protein